jgi:hypothetical protein
VFGECGGGNGCVAAFIRHTGQNIHFGKDFFHPKLRSLGAQG